MYAVIKTGGKQYRVAKDDVLEIERLPGTAGSKIEFIEVLMVGSGAGVKVGTPVVSGAMVSAELVEQSRGPKLIAFKKRRRKNSRRKKGHRQDLSTVRITGIVAEGHHASAASAGSSAKGVSAGKAATAGLAADAVVSKVASASTGSKAGRAFVTLKSAEGGKADDLSLIGGVGPKMEAELHKAGIFHFWQLAGMTAGDVTKLEATGEIGPRVGREEWVAQAQELLAGKPPRAKTDRDRAGS
jgi:large subunit ribosomal protein L21